MGKVLAFKRQNLEEPKIEVGDFVLFPAVDAFGSAEHQALVMGLSHLLDGRTFAILCRLDNKRTEHIERAKCRRIEKRTLTGGLRNLVALDPLRGQGVVVEETMRNGILHVVMTYAYNERSPLISVDRLRFFSVKL